MHTIAVFVVSGRSLCCCWCYYFDVSACAVIRSHLDPLAVEVNRSGSRRRFPSTSIITLFFAVCLNCSDAYYCSTMSNTNVCHFPRAITRKGRETGTFPSFPKMKESEFDIRVACSLSQWNLILISTHWRRHRMASSVFFPNFVWASTASGARMRWTDNYSFSFLRFCFQFWFFYLSFLTSIFGEVDIGDFDSLHWRRTSSTPPFSGVCLLLLLYLLKWIVEQRTKCKIGFFFSLIVVHLRFPFHFFFCWF